MTVQGTGRFDNYVPAWTLSGSRFVGMYDHLREVHTLNTAVDCSLASSMPFPMLKDSSRCFKLSLQTRMTQNCKLASSRPEDIVFQLFKWCVSGNRGVRVGRFVVNAFPLSTILHSGGRLVKFR